jgi:uncharacterized alkaline shock family protein YloU
MRQMSERDRQRHRSPLESGRGITTVKDGVVSRIAGIAAGEVEGIRMGGSASRAAGGVLENVTGSQGMSRGVSVEVGKVETAIDLTMAVEYGRDIPQLTEQVRNRIAERVETLTGLRVTELNVTIDDIIFPDRKEGGERRGGSRSGTRGEDRPQVQRTEEVRTSSGREYEVADTESFDVGAHEWRRFKDEGSREFGDRGEVRVEDVPLEEDQTAELKLDEETRRIRRRDRRRET